MRRKRFAHYAHIICDKFCGWEKWPDDSRFSSRPSGEIVVDVLGEQGTLDGTPHSFAAALAVRVWLLDDLAKNSIPVTALSKVRIELSFLCNPLPESPAPGYELHFWGRGVVVSGEDGYEVEYKKSERYLRAQHGRAD